MSRRPFLAASVCAALALSAALPAAAVPPRAAPADSIPTRRAAPPAAGLSGALRVAVVRALDVLDLPFLAREGGAESGRYRWVPLFGTRPSAVLGELSLASGLHAPASPGVWQLSLGDGAEHANTSFTVITQVPFAQKRGGYLNGYFIGRYATEQSGRTDRYAPPSGFIEVTPENRDLALSEHLRLGQFITKDQANVWPKYVALDLRLIDKLELVLQELNAMGVRAERLHVMSGYRTPQYNDKGVGEGGRAKLSRHTYGDAADVWVDNEGAGYISDLNGDGRRDVEDARLILQAVERVEKRYPELVGGAGAYLPSAAHGPFVHIDVRGTRARW